MTQPASNRSFERPTNSASDDGTEQVAEVETTSFARRQRSIELEKVLDLATEIQNRMDKLRSLVLQTEARMLGFIGLGLLEAAGIVLSFAFVTDFRGYLLAGLCAILVLVSASLASAYSRQLQRFRDDFETEWRTLTELTELLRSLEADVARSDDWSPLKRAAFRMRLARINVQHSSASSLASSPLVTLARRLFP